MNIQNQSKKVGAVVIAIIAFFTLLGWAGKSDFTDYCILHMTQQEYDTIKSLLTQQDGHEPSEHDIASWWAEHQAK